MTYKDALDSVDYWMKEFSHARYGSNEEIVRIIKMIKREIEIGLRSGLISMHSEYIESAMGKILKARYPQITIGRVEDFAISPNKNINGLGDILKFGNENPHKISHLDYMTAESISKFCSIRKYSIPISSFQSLIPENSKITIRDGRFVLSTESN